MRREVVLDPNPEVIGLDVEAVKFEQYRTMTWRNLPSINVLFKENPDAMWTLIDNASTVLPRRRIAE